MYGYYGYPGYGPAYIGAASALPSEAEFLLAANKLMARPSSMPPRGRQWYQLFAARIAEGQTDGARFNTSESTSDLASARQAFRVMTQGRSDGAPLFAFVVLYTLDGNNKVIDSQWWADARYVNTSTSAPSTDADRAARVALGWR